MQCLRCQRENRADANRRENWTRRAFVSGLTAVGTAGLLGLHQEPAASEAPPETNKIKLPQTPAICEAPQYVVRDLLRAEGFSVVEYVKIDLANPSAAGLLERQLASGAIDIGFNFAAPVVVQIDAGNPIALLAGIHSGCFELFGTDRVRASGISRGKPLRSPCSEERSKSTSPA